MVVHQHNGRLYALKESIRLLVKFQRQGGTIAALESHRIQHIQTQFHRILFPWLAPWRFPRHRRSETWPIDRRLLSYIWSELANRDKERRWLVLTDPLPKEWILKDDKALWVQSRIAT